MYSPIACQSDDLVIPDTDALKRSVITFPFTNVFICSIPEDGKNVDSTDRRREERGYALDVLEQLRGAGVPNEEEANYKMLPTLDFGPKTRSPKIY